MHLRKLLDWKTVLIYLHRWVGIVLGLVFVVWFASGVAMMYVGMPRLSDTERLGHMKPLDFSSARIEPADAARRYIAGPLQTIEMSFDGRPIYRFAGDLKVYADTGDLAGGVNAEAAVAFVRRWLPQYATSVRYDGYVVDSDQWTLGERQGTLPLHRIAVGDPAGTHYYVSEVTGEPTMKTDRRSRVLGYVSAVLHWTYFTSLRRNGPLWLQTVAWAALIGAVMTFAGFVVGIVRTRFFGVYRLRSGTSHSPYAGWMKWHHYAGLIFGVLTITWAFSGAMSLDRPFTWMHTAPPTQAQRTAVARTPLRNESITIERIRTALKQFEPSFVPKELDVLQFQGEPYFIGARPPEPFDYLREIGSNDERSQGDPRREHLIISATAPERGAFRRFNDDSMWTIAKAAMPGTPIRDAAWLTDYDSYYYDQYGSRPLPVLRVRYADEAATWLYLEPSRGTMMRQDRLGRWDRWLYHGLHSLDFPFLYRSRPLWDIVLIVFSIGGLVVSASTLVPSWRRLARHARRLGHSRKKSRLKAASTNPTLGQTASRADLSR
jgi:hypothetical protein